MRLAFASGPSLTSSAGPRRDVVPCRARLETPDSLPASPLRFVQGARDPGSRARRGTLLTSRGSIETPVFMPVGTRATVTGLTPDDLLALDAPILLANTYHLMLRPGPELFRRVGGIHKFMRWPRPGAHRLGRLPDLLAAR